LSLKELKQHVVFPIPVEAGSNTSTVAL
jgi:hypothetical protein